MFIAEQKEGTEVFSDRKYIMTLRLSKVGDKMSCACKKKIPRGPRDIFHWNMTQGPDRN